MPLDSYCLIAAVGVFSLGGVTVRVPTEKSTIQEAIDSSLPGDTILVGPGEYLIVAPLTFRGKDLTVMSSDGAEATAIRMVGSGQRSSVVVFEAGETSNASLDGFTIQEGKGDTQGDSTYGGGIACLDGTRPTLRNLIIQRNRATYGGAVYCRKSSPTLIDCVLAQNRVRCGGGIYCEAASPTLIRCRIEGNRGSYASTVHSKVGSTPLLRGCTIIGNETYYGGGVDSFQSSPVLINCAIVGNQATMGGAAYCSGGTLVLLHCTIVSNRSGSGMSVSEGVDLRNCILWDNYYPSPSVPPSCIQGVDPLFRDAGEFTFTRYAQIEIAGIVESMPYFVIRPPDLRIRPGSPAIDRVPADPEVPEDIEGKSRPCGPLADIGAYEECGPMAGNFRRGDPNADGSQDIADVIAILFYLFSGSTALPCIESSDLDDDGQVDLSDAIALLSNLFLDRYAVQEPFLSCGSDPTPDALTCNSYPACSSGTQ